MLQSFWKRCLYIYIYIHIYIYIYIKPLKSEVIHETGLSGNVVASFFPPIIFILFCFNVLSTVTRENRLADFLYIYIYIAVSYIYIYIYIYIYYIV